MRCGPYLLQLNFNALRRHNNVRCCIHSVYRPTEGPGGNTVRIHGVELARLSHLELGG